MNEDISLERLDRQLAMCSSILDDCGHLIVDLELNPKENVRRIADALLLIFDIQGHIYKQRPDLTPDHLKKGWNRPMSATEGAQYQLAILRIEADNHRRYVERLERGIGEIERTTK
jgi:hypothetical protein